MSLPLITLSILPISQPDKSIQISKDLIRQFGIRKDQEITISLGKTTLSLPIEAADIKPHEIIFTENVLKQFCLPIQAYQFHAAYYPATHTLQLGPVIGLLTDFHTDHEGKPQFRSIHMFCEELHHGIKESGGFFYVFSHKDFPTKGYYFHEENWVSSELPLPDVIYNRIHSRKLEHSNSFKEFRKKLNQLNIPFFNDRFLSKWEVHEHLIREKHLLHFIPDTMLFSHDSLIDFAGKYNTFFIKPVHGSQGKNIIKITKTEDGLFVYQTSYQSISTEKKFRLNDLFQQIKPILGNRIYIIQQGIFLLSYNGSPIDFRILCHKNKQNKWQVTSIVARISAEREFVSNIASGGQIVKPLKALQTRMSRKQAIVIMDLLKELSIETADTISKYTNGITGELGIDIGVDLEGNLQIIEVNFKPSKSFEDGLLKIRPSAKAIIQFCTMLSFDEGPNQEE